MEKRYEVTINTQKDSHVFEIDEEDFNSLMQALDAGTGVFEVGKRAVREYVFPVRNISHISYTTYIKSEDDF